MAQSYGDSFWFVKSNGLDNPESKYRIPANATAATGWLQGALVEPDPSAPGYLKLSADDAPYEPGFRGILTQEENIVQDDFMADTATIYSSRQCSRVLAGALANINFGTSIDLAYKNLPVVAATTMQPGYAAETRVTMDTLAVGTYIGWSGTAWEYKATRATAVGIVKAVTSDTVVFTLLG